MTATINYLPAEWLGWEPVGIKAGDMNEADLKRIVGKQEEELHQAELRVAALEAENALVIADFDRMQREWKAERENGRTWYREAVALQAELATARAMVAERDQMLKLACIDLARDSKEWHEERNSCDTGYNEAWFLADLRARAEAEQEAK